MPTLKSLAGMRNLSVIATLLLFQNPAQADVIFDFEITQAGHLLQGAHVTSTATGNFNWESPAGYTATSQYAAVGDSIWQTVISGATGSGAAWNGTYTYDSLASFPNVGVAYFSHGLLLGPTRLSATGSTNTPRWISGGNSFFLAMRSTGNPAPPADGTPVDFSGMTWTVNSFQKSGGSAPDFGLAAGIATVTATVTAVPEPSSFALLGLGGIGLLVRRRRKSRAMP